MSHFSNELLPMNRFNGEITAEEHIAYITLHRLMVYFRYLRIKTRNTEPHSWHEKILNVHFSTKEN